MPLTPLTPMEMELDPALEMELDPLIPSQKPVSQAVTPSQSQITPSQRDRMERSRLVAKARRAAQSTSTPWERKAAGDILKKLGPKKTGHLYDIAWEKFEKFRESAGAPEEQDFIQYFDFLREGRKFKASTLWNTYAKLNSCHKRRYGKALKDWPRLKMQLETYEHGYERKTAAIFTLEQIKQALLIDETSPKWILRKGKISVRFFSFYLFIMNTFYSCNCNLLLRRPQRSRASFHCCRRCEGGV